MVARFPVSAYNPQGGVASEPSFRPWTPRTSPYSPHSIPRYSTATSLPRMVNQDLPSTTPRVAIVTGAAQGIGEAIALRLADDGIDVVVNDLPRKNDQLDAVVKAIQAKGRRAAAVAGDATVEADVVALVDAAVKEFGGLDIVRRP